MTWTIVIQQLTAMLSLLCACNGSLYYTDSYHIRYGSSSFGFLQILENTNIAYLLCTGHYTRLTKILSNVNRIGIFEVSSYTNQDPAENTNTFNCGFASGTV